MGDTPPRIPKIYSKQIQVFHSTLLLSPPKNHLFRALRVTIVNHTFTIVAKVIPQDGIIYKKVQGASKLPLFFPRYTAYHSNGRRKWTKRVWDLFLCLEWTAKWARRRGLSCFKSWRSSEKQPLNHWSLVKIDQFDNIFAGHLNFNTSAKWLSNGSKIHGRTTPRKFDKWIPRCQEWWDLEKVTAFFELWSFVGYSIY